MDGLIVLDKPLRLTSARALDHVRRITGIRKSGHAGTLDPLATGVLVICLGRATKLVERLMAQPKVYRVTMRLDITSASYDLESPPIEVDATPPSEGLVQEAMRALEGDIEQVPPLASALKVGGRPAYRFHRKGDSMELSARPVVVYWLALHAYQWPEAKFSVACGRGTYVRALVRDLGASLGAGGCLTALERSAIGPFAQQNAWTLEALQAGDWRQAVIPLENAIELVAEPAIPPRPGGVS